MAHTLRRSRSKYGRTRRQRKKEKKMQGGGFFDDFVKTFKPSTPEEKCEKAKKNAEEACNSMSSEISQQELDSEFSESPTPSVETAALPEPLEHAIASESNVMPGSESEVAGSSVSAPLSPPIAQSSQPAVALEPQMPPSMSEPDLSMTQAAPASSLTPNVASSASSDQKYNGLGGGTKRKRKNKKQNRRKKMKSRKHKK